MRELIGKIGLPRFVQIAIECWNEMVVLILLLTVLFSELRCKHNESVTNAKTADFKRYLTYWLLFLIYNISDIILILIVSSTSDKCKGLRSCGYCIFQGIGMLVFLYLGIVISINGGGQKK